MKKYQLLAGLFLAAMAFTACTDDDYTDWAEPQSNAPEEAAVQIGINASAGASINMDTFYQTVEAEAQETDSVEIAKLSSSNGEVASFVLNGVTINGVSIPAVLTASNGVKVNTLELDAMVRQAFFSRAHVERTLDVQINASAKLTSGAAVNVACSANPKFTPITTPAICADGYVLLGDFVENGDGWDTSAPVVMAPVSEGVYQATIQTKNDGSNWFKFYESFDTAGGWDAANKGQMGCMVNGDEAKDNFVVWTGDVYGVQTPVIAGQGHYVITLDMNNLTYSVREATAYLYMAGDVNSWKQVDVLASPSFNNIYVGYMYLNQNGFKFCTQENWNGTNYGENFNTAGDAGNIMMTEEEGFYQVTVDLNKPEMTLVPVSTIGLVGDATPGGWPGDTPTDTPMTYDKENRCWKVTAELGDGEFKFRANEAWAINWGYDADNKLLIQDGSNIKVSAGKYLINFYPLCQGKSHFTIEAAE
ncbi:MAG: DUF5115 domain-containing protein [Bacteroides sp.]